MGQTGLAVPSVHIQIPVFYRTWAPDILAPFPICEVGTSGLFGKILEVMQRAQSRAQQLTLQQFLPANCGFPCCYFVPLWFASSFDWVGAGENLRMLRGCGNLISEIKKVSPGDRRGLGQVHMVSQKGAGPAPRPAESRGALLAGRHPAWSPPAAQPGTGLCGHVLPHALRPPASGATTLPWGHLGFLRPTSGPPQRTSSLPWPVIALTAPWGWGSLVLIHITQVSRAETSGRATSHSLGLVSAPRKPLPAHSRHHQPQAAGSCTLLVSAAPPAPAHPQPAAQPPSHPQAGHESACPGEQAPSWGIKPLKTSPHPHHVAKPHPGCSQILSHCDQTVLTTSGSVHHRGRNRGTRLAAPYPFAQGWGPAMPHLSTGHGRKDRKSTGFGVRQMGVPSPALSLLYCDLIW